ncbi:MAG: aspartate/glutamate racemase family protein [Bacteroidota bacterium]|jgi:aspartate racemase
MKTIGLVGGTSWVSTVDSYRLLNELVNQQLGGTNFARCILYSFNFADIEDITRRQDWSSMLEIMTPVCRNLAGAGAECIMLGANTLHVIADDLRTKIDVPLIHIAEATGEVIKRRKLKKVGLLGTKFTMEMDFFKKKLAARGIETVIPPEADREFVHLSIFEELGKGVFQDSTKQRYLQIIEKLAAEGAEGIVLGCTEIPMLIKQTDSPLPLFDTVTIHAEAGVDFALTTTR